ncbi:MAG TPA: patatin-like phospholipase family protein [Limnochordia bacterium]|nr:patatin-like phospholipase family protein [Limnochordia bacterium]
MPYPTVGVALGSGAARGLANLGVLQVLEEAGIPVDIVCGTSAGAVVAGLYASGSDLNLLGRMVQELDWNDLTSWTLRPRGLVVPDKIHQMLRLLTREQRFEDLPIKAAVVATNLLTGEEVVLDSGSVADAIVASLSIPGVFVPVEKDGLVLVDGALVNRVPGDLCRRMGAELVIAVDVGWGPLRSRIRHLPDVIIQTIDILNRQAASRKPIDCDLLIEPDLGNVTFTQLNRAAEIVEKGRQAAWEVLPAIKKRLDQGS